MSTDPSGRRPAKALGRHGGTHYISRKLALDSALAAETDSYVTTELTFRTASGEQKATCSLQIKDMAFDILLGRSLSSKLRFKVEVDVESSDDSSGKISFCQPEVSATYTY